MTDSSPERTGERSARRELLRDPAFRRFLAARVATDAGAALTTVALPVLVYQRTGSALQTALLLSAYSAPYLLFGLFAGAVADRGDRRRLMVGGDLAGAVLLGSVPLAAALDVLTLPHVYLVALGSAVCFVWFDAANFGALPALVGRDRILDAQSILWSTQSVLGVAGPAVGGILVATVGPAMMLTVDAVSYLLSAWALASIRRPFRTVAAAVHGSIRSRIREGLRFLWGHPVIRALTLVGTGNSFAGGVVLGLIVVLGVEQLGLAADDGRLGLLFTAGALGSLCAGVALPRLARRFAVGTITLTMLGAALLGTVALALTSALAPALALLFAWNTAYWLVILSGITYRQRATPDELQGRVNVVGRMVAWGGQPLGAAAGGVVASAAGVDTALLVAGGVLLATLAGAAASVLRSTEPPRRG